MRHSYIWDEVTIDHGLFRGVEGLANDEYESRIENSHPIFE